MRFANKATLIALLASAALASAIPAIGQDAPKSILPPGFGEPDAPPKDDPETSSKPTDLLPDVKIQPPGTQSVSSGSTGTATAATTAPDGTEVPVDEDGNPLPVVVTLQDLPPSARRSTAQVGILEADDGDMGAAGFGAERGPYLTYLMRHLQMPIASRWSSILLRRALLSKVETPRGVGAADWVAERAWLLIRMGEAQAAQQLVQSVDIDQYTPKLFEVAMQASLAAADPAGLCPMVEAGSAHSKEPAWPFARAICSALAGESSVASAQIDSARSRGPGAGIDGLLAEKVVGAGGNTRRAVVIQWDDVNQLTAWRYGMATATAIDIPDRLLATVGPHVRAWRARAPLISVDKRIGDSEIAAALGVFSSDALVDQYGAWADATDANEARGKPFLLLNDAYSADTEAARVDAMRSLWTATGLDARGQYARLILTARAAARLTPSDDLIGDSGNLLGAMLTAGLDIQAARWAKLVSDDSSDSAKQGWALLAVGAPGKVVDWNTGSIKNYNGNAGSPTGNALLFAGMAGLARIGNDDISSMAESLSVPVGRQTAWTRALERAVAGREPATVALLCAVGLQNPDWKKIPPVQLYHIVSALRRVGLAGEARMIAAEAITRG
jgi:hypothetical protein